MTVNKCPCGYEAGHKWEGTKEIKVGQSEFEEIQGAFTVYNDYSGGLVQVRLLICPKCGNVIAEG